MSVKAKILAAIVLFTVCLSVILFAVFAEGESFLRHLPKIILMIASAVLLVVRLLIAGKNEKTFRRETLREDMEKAHAWIVEALESSGYRADGTLESFREIDRFFDEENKPGGILSQNTGMILFSLGVYVGNVILRNAGGEWDIENCTSETELCVKLNNETAVFPIQRVMKRYKQGSDESIYAYGCSVCRKSETSAE